MHDNRYDDFTDLVEWLKPGHAYRRFINDNNPNNGVLHVRGIVDDQVVFATWSNNHQAWGYHVCWIGRFRGYVDSGWLAHAGKSRAAFGRIVNE